MNPAAEHLKDEVHRALDLLTNLTRPNPPQNPLGELNPKAIKHCRGIFFFHTKKVGLALGLKWGAGVLVAHILDENGKESWSAPVLFKVHEVSLGLLAGVGNIQTMLILGSEKAVDQFRVGAKKGPVVLGQDLSLGKTLGFDVVEDANIFASRDIITHSLADGAIVDWSLIGGKISVDKDANSAIYGEDADLEKVLGAPSSTHSPPAALKPLYDALDGIATDAEGDMRKFNGFRKHWSPDTSELKAKDA
ncbi:probable SH3 domain-containing YSC84-like protein 1 [Coccomyxa sp. Obi]|nr:probable SH3 domain-containing YSC84-like protein 1 [Coccomyxa sp. Obi]